MENYRSNGKEHAPSLNFNLNLFWTFLRVTSQFTLINLASSFFGYKTQYTRIMVENNKQISIKDAQLKLSF